MKKYHRRRDAFLHRSPPSPTQAFGLPPISFTVSPGYAGCLGAGFEALFLTAFGAGLWMRKGTTAAQVDGKGK